MSLTFEDFERSYPSSEQKQSEKQTTSSVVKKPSVGVKPTMSEALSQTWDKVSPVISSAAERAINPIHYKGDQEDYTNIDWPLTAIHAGGEAIAAKRIWDFATGKTEEREIKRMTAEQFKRQNDIAEANRETRNAPKPIPKPAPVAAPAAPQNPLGNMQPPAPPVAPGAPAATVQPNVPVGGVSPAQAAAAVGQIQPHPNPITAIQPSTLSQVGASNLAAQTKEAIAAQKKGVAPAVEAANDVAKSTAVAEFSRDSKGNIKWPDKMSPAAKAGAEAFATQFPDIAKTLETEGRFGILGAGSGDNNLFNSYGADFAKTLRNEVNQGQMVGTYGNYKGTVNPAIKAIPPETEIGKQLAELRAKEPEGGTHGRLGTPAAVENGKLITAKNAFNKALKGGAAGALLMSIADAANAQEAARNVGEALLPLGMTPSELQSGKLTAKQLKAFEEAQKLGSPYRSVPPTR